MGLFDHSSSHTTNNTDYNTDNSNTLAGSGGVSTHGDDNWIVYSPTDHNAVQAALSANAANSIAGYGLAGKTIDTVQSVNQNALDTLQHVNTDSLNFGGDAIKAIQNAQQTALGYQNTALQTAADATNQAATASQNATKDALDFAFNATRPEGEATQQRLALAAIAVAGLMVLALARKGK